MSEAEKTLKSKSGGDFFKQFFQVLVNTFVSWEKMLRLQNLLHKAIFNWLYGCMHLEVCLWTEKGH